MENVMSSDNLVYIKSIFTFIALVTVPYIISFIILAIINREEYLLDIAIILFFATLLLLTNMPEPMQMYKLNLESPIVLIFIVVGLPIIGVAASIISTVFWANNDLVKLRIVYKYTIIYFFAFFFFIFIAF